MLLTTTLAVEYLDGADIKHLHLTLDQEDLLVLQSQMNRLHKKIALLQEQARLQEIPVLVVGSP